METVDHPPSEACFGNIEFLPFSLETLTALFILVVLLILSALISGSEVALFSLEPKEIESLKSSKKRSSQLVIHLLSMPERLLATILVGNNFVNIAIVLLAAHISDSLIDFSNDKIEFEDVVKSAMQESMMWEINDEVRNEIEDNFRFYPDINSQAYTISEITDISLENVKRFLAVFILSKAEKVVILHRFFKKLNF